MPEPRWALQAEQLSLGPGGQAILSGVGLKVAPGSAWALVGPNGAGKSTLLRALAGLQPPLEGRIFLGGAPLAGLSPQAQALRRAHLPQELPQGLAFGVEELAWLAQAASRPAWARGAEGARARQEALASLGLEALASSPLDRLSGGQRQRAYLAATLATEAPLLLLDEPTAHLDLVHQLGLLRCLEARRQARGEASILVLHDLNLAAQFADHLAILSEGRLLAQGPVAELLEPSLLRAAFGLDFVVRRHPQSGKPYLLPPSAEGQRGATGPLRPAPRGPLHLVAGGGAGERLLPALHRLGFRLSVGVLNLLDGDEQAAEALGVEVLVEAPFSPLGPEALGALRACLEEAEQVVVGDVAWGPGNLANLEAVASLAGRKRIWLIASQLGERDFTHGRATELWQGLQAAGAEVLSEAELLERLRQG